MAMVDLEELETGSLDMWPLFSSRTTWSITSLLERDHCCESIQSAPGSPQPLRQRVLEAVAQAIGAQLPQQTRVRLMTGLRIFGIEFNPVSFYFVYLSDTEKVDYLVAEVSNIPWLEQHLYVLEPVTDGTHCTKSSKLRPFQGHPKAFHVSPFIDMENIRYSWLVSNPSQDLRMKIGLERSDQCFFMAGLSARRYAFSAANLALIQVTHPMQTLKVITGIMWEAGKLFRKGFEFVPHPDAIETAASRAIAFVVGLHAKLTQLVKLKRTS